MGRCPVKHHGMTKAVGCSHIRVGNFSRLFPDLPPLAVSEAEAVIIGGPGGLMHDYDGTSGDNAIPAGYTFFAQFVDHDVTLDTSTGLRDAPRTPDEVAELPNIRSASLDLDCVYGFGPEASPHIYDADRPGRIAVNANGIDLARSPGGVALIGDPRNDENMFVSQLQLLFHRFHNRIHDERVYQETSAEPFNRFEEAQRETRYHYQWLVLFDFLKRLCDRDVFQFAAKRLLSGSGRRRNTFPLVYGPDGHGKLPMPVEFSVAAYRVGHTMVRSVYAANARHTDIELFDEAFGTLGFSGLPAELEVDWRYLLPVEDCIRPRMGKAIDPLLANELQNLPTPVVPSNNPADRALAFRNLLRGNALGLPSGQAVAGALDAAGYPGVSAAFDLELDDVPGWSRLDALQRGKSPLRDNTPLFYYVLRESELRHGGERFGPVGSAILMEVFGGMLALCDTSFLSADDWHPDPCISKERYHDWCHEHPDPWNHERLIEEDDYYPFELADVVRFVEDL